MSKKDMHREQLLMALGKDLSRRAKSSCELCSERTSLFVVEVPPLPEEPGLDTSIFICEFCKKRVTYILPAKTKKKSSIKSKQNTGSELFVSNSILFLQEKVWSEIKPVQVASILLTDQAKSLGYGWAVEILDSLYLEEEIEHWVQILREHSSK